MKRMIKNKGFQNRKMAEFARFCIVGGVCTGIDATIFYLVRGFASYPVALVSGYLLSLIINYFLTVYWTFKAKASVWNAVGIIAAHLFNLFVVRMGMMYILVQLLVINDRVAYIPTLLTSIISNFIIIKLVVNRTQ